MPVPACDTEFRAKASPDQQVANVFDSELRETKAFPINNFGIGLLGELHGARGKLSM
jgi:hypothetical protein